MSENTTQDSQVPEEKLATPTENETEETVTEDTDDLSLTEVFRQQAEARSPMLADHETDESEKSEESTEVKTQDKEDESESKEEPEEDAPLSEVEDLKDQIAIMEKRLRDTKDYSSLVNSKTAIVLQKLSEGEVPTEKEIEALQSAFKPETNDLQQTVERINGEIPIAASAAMLATGETKEEIQEAVQAFNFLAISDNTLLTELNDQPVEAQAAFVINKGRKLKELHSLVNEHEGSPTKALQNAVSISNKKEKALKAEIREQVEKEFKETYKDYVSPERKTKPQIRGAAATPQGDNDNTASDFSLSDVFK